MGRLENRVAIVTGGANGIGKAVCERFSREGSAIAIWDMSESGEELAQSIRQTGGSAEFMRLSVTDKEAVERAAQKTHKAFGKIDILINNAGVLRDKTLTKMSDEEWDLSIDVNLKGAFYCTRAVVPFMRENGYGRIVSASSIAGVRGNYGQSNYSAAKSGLIGMTKTWAVELARYGITANTIAPGAVDTEMMASVPEEAKAVLNAQVPMGRMATVDEIANGYLFLASEESSYVTAVCLSMDGGMAR